MKIYKNLVNSVALTLQEIFIKNRFADKALEKTFKQNIQWGSRDRRFVAEAVYDITRNFRLYSYLAETNNNFWFITAVWLVIKNNQIPDWQEFKHVNPNVILAKKESLKTNLPIYESYPDWLWDFCSAELGKAEWETEAIAMNRQAPVFLRANTLKTTRDKLAESLKKDGIETLFVKGAIDALELVKRENIFQNKAFKEGWFELQDAGSQLISEFIEPKSNELVIDACAGAGGKSLHLAALMKNKGKIISLDVEEFKLKELKRRALRAGAFNIETRVIEEGKTIADLTNKADRLLLDVPCSGLGVLKRNPDAKWKLTQESINRTIDVQHKIITEYSKTLKSSGVLVYSTCSILPIENRKQVDYFLQNNPNFELIKDKLLMPSQGFDGFYMALIKKQAD